MANSNYTIGSIQETIKKELIRTNQIPMNETTAIYLFSQQKLLKASDGNSSTSQCLRIWPIEGMPRIIFCICTLRRQRLFDSFYRHHHIISLSL